MIEEVVRLKMIRVPLCKRCGEPATHVAIHRRKWWQLVKKHELLCIDHAFGTDSHRPVAGMIE